MGNVRSLVNRTIFPEGGRYEMKVNSTVAVLFCGATMRQWFVK